MAISNCLQNKYFHENHGRNINITGDTATWSDQTGHLFGSKAPIIPTDTLNFTFEGTGHSFVGVGYLKDEQVSWVMKFSIQVNYEFGEGFLHFFDDFKIVMGVKDEIREWIELPDGELTDLFVFIDIRFGSIKFQTGEFSRNNKFLVLGKNGTMDNNKFGLKTPKPGTFCVCKKPMSMEYRIELGLEPVTAASYWTANIVLSNFPPEIVPRSYSDIFKIGSFENEQGTIQLQFRPKGIIICSFKTNRREIQIQNIHLGRDIYMWIELFRCTIRMALLKNDESDPMGYVRVVLISNPVGSQTDISSITRPKRQQDTQICDQQLFVVPASSTMSQPRTVRVLDSPLQRDNISCRLTVETTPHNADDDTMVKTCIEGSNGDITELAQYLNTLSSIKTMIENTLSSIKTMIENNRTPISYYQMYHSMQTQMWKIFQEMENSNVYNPLELRSAHFHFMDTFSSIHAVLD
ncbi:uncharacterized protein LOC126815126 [Patella vulgata]|uniref:uncharacterized protein LOC126815126 n=1 Tax=Patella vulgata TaxID=6465 RepID=UPI00217F3953|nr:uncharacterized protein LOC126815126 [Patella vulgata]